MLLLGPTGSGKEVFARYVHAVSDRTGPFVPVNCAAVSEGLFESAFFGHRRGAFTGATQDFAGFARAATGGTLFLDEVAEMSPEAQAKLLRFLDSGDVVPVGSTTPQRVDVRILAATNQDLESLMNDERFRPDLFARLAGCQIRIPPLSARPEDVIDIALHHVPQGLSPDAAEALVLHDWPYNVRELHAVLDMARLEAPPGEPLPLASLPEPIRERVLYRSPPARKSGQATGTSGPEPGEERSPTSEELSALYRECNGNVSEMARRMDKDRRQIYRWLERFGIRPRS